MKSQSGNPSRDRRTHDEKPCAGSHSIEIERIEHTILNLRGHRVMLDRDLASLYGVKPIALRQQVKRNRERFPSDFMFQLSGREVDGLVSQNVIPSRRSLGGFLPYAFTEEGVAMLSGVLHSRLAVRVNIAIMRAFVRVRLYLETHRQLAAKLAELEGKIGTHDGQIQVILEAIRELMTPPKPPRSRIGFQAPDRGPSER